MRYITLLSIVMLTLKMSAQNSVATDRYPVSPNPSNGQIQLTLPPDQQEISLAVYNVLGMQLLRRQISAPEGTVLIDLSSEPAGVYMLNIHDSYGTTTKKVIVK